MTLIVTAFFPSYVIQASDRRFIKEHQITKERKLHDPFANKSVIYVGINCRFLIGYCGLAYIRGRPIDDWIVEVLHGRRVERGVISFDTSARALHAAQLLQRLSTIEAGTSISVGGYQRTRRGWDPRFWEVQHGVIHEIEISRDCTNVPIAYMPADWLSEHEIAAIRQRIMTTPNVTASRENLVDLIRTVAAREVSVGADIMVSTVWRDEPAVEAGFYLSDAAPDKAGISYSPAFVTDIRAMAPSLLDESRRTLIFEKDGPIAYGKPVRDPGDLEVVWNINHHFTGGGAFETYMQSVPPTSW